MSKEGWAGKELKEAIFPPITKEEIINLYRNNVMFEILFEPINNLFPIGNKKILCLQIGTWDNSISLDKLCDHPESKLYFLNRSDIISNPKAISLNNNYFDYVYINVNSTSYQDIILSFDKLKINGMMFFDNNINLDDFLNRYKDKYELLFRNHQVGIKKISNKELVYHVYAVNWNEERLLPLFFKHYKDADKIYVIDNYSTDSSHELINKFGGNIILYDTQNTFDDQTLQNIKNNAWKPSIGIADYIIIQDVDEFVFFPKNPDDIRGALKDLQENKITLVKLKGYNMICTDEKFESVLNSEQEITSAIQTGWRFHMYDKSNILNPNKISEINFLPGAHVCNPVGEIILEQSNGLLLHYKYIGEKYLLKRYKLIRDRMSMLNKECAFSIHYCKTDEEFKEEFKDLYEKYLNSSIRDIMYPSN